MRKKEFLMAGLCLMLMGTRLYADAIDTPAAWTDKDDAKFKKTLEKRTEKRLHFVSYSLNLTPDQKDAVLKVLQDRNDEMAAQEKEFREKRAALRNETRDKFMQLFTPEQQHIYLHGSGQEGGSRLHNQDPMRYRGGGLDEDN